MSKQIEKYPLLSRIFHDLVLGNDFVGRAAFDVDRFFVPTGDTQYIDSPVFVSGLARAGTTLLLNTLYKSGVFASLTYRDMPLVLAPGMWNTLSGAYRQEVVSSERAHGDGVMYDFDSPEEFEEVFWRVFQNEDYIKKDKLVSYVVSNEERRYFRKYISRIIASKKSFVKLRYLSKNNNNLLRLSSLFEMFPRAVFLVPFRNPNDHASSLLRQHLLFLQIHKENAFSRRYMRYLVHHEFGDDMLPFYFGNELPGGDAMKLDYWLRYWNYVYEYIWSEYGDKIILWDYDEFCRNPGNTLGQLERILRLTPGSLIAHSDDIHDSRVYDVTKSNTDLEKINKDLYERLRKKAKEDLLK